MKQSYQRRLDQLEEQLGPEEDVVIIIRYGDKPDAEIRRILVPGRKHGKLQKQTGKTGK